MTKAVEMDCTVCGAGSEWKFDKHGFAVFRCRGCGFGFIDPVPTEEQLNEIYQDPKYFLGGGEYGYKEGYETIADSLKPVYERRLQDIETVVPAGSVLDVGAATGMFAEIARRRNWNAICLERSEFCRSVLAEKGLRAIADFSETDAKVDLVTMWEVLEHSTEPRAQLRSSIDCLHPDGMLAISVPNGSNMWVQKQPEQWCHLKPPEHIWYFDLNSLRKLLDEFGMEIVRCHGECLVSTDYSLKVRPQWKSLGRKLLSRVGYESIRDTIWRPIKQRQLDNFKRRAQQYDELALNDTLVVYAKRAARRKAADALT